MPSAAVLKKKKKKKRPVHSCCMDGLALHRAGARVVSYLQTNLGRSPPTHKHIKSRGCGWAASCRNKKLTILLRSLARHTSTLDSFVSQSDQHPTLIAQGAD